MSGALVIVGLGPGSADLLTPAAARALHAATDLVGYGPYLDRIAESIPGQRRRLSALSVAPPTSAGTAPIILCHVALAERIGAGLHLD